MSCVVHTHTHTPPCSHSHTHSDTHIPVLGYSDMTSDVPTLEQHKKSIPLFEFFWVGKTWSSSVLHQAFWLLKIKNWAFPVWRQPVLSRHITAIFFLFFWQLSFFVGLPCSQLFLCEKIVSLSMLLVGFFFEGKGRCRFDMVLETPSYVWRGSILYVRHEGFTYAFLFWRSILSKGLSLYDCFFWK